LRQLLALHGKYGLRFGSGAHNDLSDDHCGTLARPSGPGRRGSGRLPGRRPATCSRPPRPRPPWRRLDDPDSMPTQLTRVCHREFSPASGERRATEPRPRRR
jgi:hypothetical protein